MEEHKKILLKLLDALNRAAEENCILNAHAENKPKLTYTGLIKSPETEVVFTVLNLEDFLS